LEGVVGRNAERLIREALADTRVALINGARQPGKSMLTALIAGSKENSIIRGLDRPETLAAAQEGPTPLGSIQICSSSTRC